MRKSFVFGLITLLPLILTYVVITFGIGLITSPFERLVHFTLDRFHLFDDGVGIFTHRQVLSFLSKTLIICALISFIFLIGFLASRIFFHSLGYYVDQILRKIPFVRKIYGPSKELVDALFRHETDTPRKAVLVPYPSLQEKAVGIVTAEFTATLHETPEPFCSVFIPATPNATSGYLCTFRKTDVTLLDLTADEALKYVMSFGASNSIAVKE